MTVEAPVGEKKGPPSKQQLFVEAYCCADFFNRLHELGTYSLLNSELASLSSFLIWDGNKKGKRGPLSFGDSERVHSGELLEPTKTDLQLLRTITETGGPSNESDLVIVRIQKDEPDCEILVIQEGRNFKGQAKRNSAEQIPTWFGPDGRLNVGLAELVRRGYYRTMSLLIPKDRKFLEDWQKKQIAKFHP